MKFDASQIDRIERDIAPPMKEVITIPAGEGIVVYVGRHAFGAGRSQAKELKAIARQIVASGELLEAARLAVLNFKRAQVSGNDLFDDDFESWTALDRAIAKAEGKR